MIKGLGGLSPQAPPPENFAYESSPIHTYVGLHILFEQARVNI